MSCAACSGKIEREVGKMEGVEACVVSLSTQVGREGEREGGVERTVCGGKIVGGVRRRERMKPYVCPLLACMQVQREGRE